MHASNYNSAWPVALDNPPPSGYNYLQSLDYTYNIRGWLTGINDPTSCATQSGDDLPDLFSMGLDYESTANGAAAQYNGNIAAMQWRSNINGTCLIRQQYRFTYDYANRLLTANHFTHNGTAWTNTNNYSESGISYDLNGNLKGYTRRGLTAPGTFGVIDQLTYTYGDALRPDRLTNMSDAGSAAKGFKFTSGAAAYAYDLNGNLSQDNHKSLTFQYNYLNLPNYISDAGGADMTLTYTADGEKLSKVSSAGTRNYVSGIEYLGNALEAIYHSEGRCTPNGASAFYYEYTIKDHLGNARVNFRANGAAVTFLQELHYYPFGMLMEGIGTAKVTDNAYKYNGKELNEDLGLNLSDYGARWYDAALGRWWSVDPLTEKFKGWSPYNYAYNNPIAIADLDGRSGIVSIDMENKTVTVTSHMIFYGSKSNSELAASIASDVQNKWNEAGGTATIGGDTYKVNFVVTGEHREELIEGENVIQGEIELNTDISKNYFRLEENVTGGPNGWDVSYMDISGNSGFFKLDNIKAVGSTTEAHEMGHGFGLDHPIDADGMPYDYRGNGQPDIMAPRGALVDPEYQWDAKATPGAKGGSLNPEKRKVTQDNIDDLNLGNLKYNSNGKSALGGLTNNFHQK